MKNVTPKNLYQRIGNTLAATAALAFWGAILLVPAAAWLTHVIYTIAAEKFLLLIVGAFVFPVGIIHGIGVWLGVW